MKIAASLVSAPLLDLRKTISELEDSGVDYLHFDLEDGVFVPEMNLGVKLIEEIRSITSLPFDVHLMMVNPEWIIPRLAGIGIDMLSFHYEATHYPRRVLRMVSDYGIKAGLAFNPKTVIPELNIYIPYIRFINILTTEPEINGGIFLPDVMGKIDQVKMMNKYENILVEVDGGMTIENSKLAVEKGVDVLVSGRGLFSEGNLRDNIFSMKHHTRNEG